jgi:hypothetical protein
VTATNRRFWIQNRSGKEFSRRGVERHIPAVPGGIDRCSAAAYAAAMYSVMTGEVARARMADREREYGHAWQGERPARHSNLAAPARRALTVTAAALAALLSAVRPA